MTGETPNPLDVLRHAVAMNVAVEGRTEKTLREAAALAQVADLAARAVAAEERVAVLEAMDMTATANQWEAACKNERARAVAAEAERDELLADMRKARQLCLEGECSLARVVLKRAVLAGDEPT